MSPPAERRVGEKWREDERELIRRYKDAVRKRDLSPLEPTRHGARAGKKDIARRDRQSADRS